MKRWELLPHEWLFNAFLLLMAGWLLVAGKALAAVFLLYALVGAVLIVWAQAHPSRLRWTIRLLWYPSVMGLTFYTLPWAVRALGTSPADPLLSHWDQQLLGAPIAVLLAPLQGPWFTDVMVLGYVFFFYYLITGPGYWCVVDVGRLRSCFAGMFSLYAVGFLGYALLPAGGPFRALQFAEPLSGHGVTGIVLPIINTASNGVDVFPSIHAAISLYLLVFDARHFRRRFWWHLLPVIALWLSTVYLRYHYFVDLIAGGLVALFGLWVAHRYEHSALAARVDAAALSQ